MHKTQLLTAGSRGEFLGRLDLRPKGKAVESLYRLVPMGENLVDHPLMVDLISAYKESLGRAMGPAGKGPMPRAIPRAPGQPFSYTLSSYAGESACLPCHEKQHQAWQKTTHAKAFQTLVSLNRATDITCLPCHTTGFEENYRRGEILENVQCEACHGPGLGHPDSKKKFSPVSDKQCLSCHNAAKSPRYHYRDYRLKVSCPQ